LSNFSLVTIGFVIFDTKILYEKRVHKMMMKLTNGECKRAESTVTKLPKFSGKQKDQGLFIAQKKSFFFSKIWFKLKT